MPKSPPDRRTDYLNLHCVQRAKGLVEIFWRGKVDSHGTMQSSSEEGTTRSGTSVQITRKADLGMQAWKAHDLDPKRVVGTGERLAFAQGSATRAAKKAKTRN